MRIELNPEALESVADAIWIHANGEHRLSDNDRRSAAYLVCRDMAEKFISAYLSSLPEPYTSSSIELFDAWEAGACHGHNAEGRLIDKLDANPYPNPDGGE